MSATATFTHPAIPAAPSMGRRLAGLWYRQSESHGLFLAFTTPATPGATPRRVRVYFPSKPMDDSPDADLWLKQGDSYKRVTGLWFRSTNRGSQYLFVPLQEGNFRVYLNDRKREDNQPDYTLYQYTDSEGNPLPNQDGDLAPVLDTQQGSEIPF